MGPARLLVSWPFLSSGLQLLTSRRPSADQMPVRRSGWSIFRAVLKRQPLNVMMQLELWTCQFTRSLVQTSGYLREYATFLHNEKWTGMVALITRQKTSLDIFFSNTRCKTTSDVYFNYSSLFKWSWSEQLQMFWKNRKRFGPTHRFCELDQNLRADSALSHPEKRWRSCQMRPNFEVHNFPVKHANLVQFWLRIPRMSFTFT